MFSSALLLLAFAATTASAATLSKEPWLACPPLSCEKDGQTYEDDRCCRKTADKEAFLVRKVAKAL